jgi:hypothetical protein
MVMPSSGPLNMGATTNPQSTNAELRRTLTAPIDMNDSVVRGLAVVGASGTQWSMSSLYGRQWGNSRAIFGFGSTTDIFGYVGTTNLVSATGVVAGDTAGVGLPRSLMAACGYGGDKGIFAYGWTGNYQSTRNLVSNTGVVSADLTGAGTARRFTSAATYGIDKGIFLFGETASGKGGATYTNAVNLVSNTGVIASNTTFAGVSFKAGGSTTPYGGDKALNLWSYNTQFTISSNYISNTGVVGADVTVGGNSNFVGAACGYGGDKGIIGDARNSNLISNTGVVSTNTSSSGAARTRLAASTYGGDKGIFAFGRTTARVNTRNLVSNTGVIGGDLAGAGSARDDLSATGYSTT